MVKYILFFFLCITFLKVFSYPSADGYSKRLIEQIAGKSKIRVVHDNRLPWKGSELEILNEILDTLPGEYCRLKPIRFKRMDIKTGSAGEASFSSVSFSRREVIIGDWDCDRDTLRRRFLRLLTRFLDYDNKISESWNWRRLSRWTGLDIFGNKPENKNIKGYAAAEGIENPALDFETSVELFFYPPPDQAVCEYLKFRLPSKYDFIRNLFSERPDPQGHFECSQNYESWINPDEVEQIELLIACPSYVSVASIAGHLLMLIRRKNDIRGLSTVIGFVADTIDGEGNVEEGLKYMLKGVLGKYPSLIQEETLYDVIHRYTIRENRDLYRLKIDLDRRQIRNLIRRLWEMKHTFTYRYYFFNKNCTTMLLNLINDVLPEDRQIPDRFSIDLPLNISSAVFRSRMARFVYPEYWSLSRRARFAAWENDRLQQEIADGLRTLGILTQLEGLAESLDRVKSLRQENRAACYERLSNLFISYYREYTADRKKGEKEYAAIGKRLLTFLMNAKDREQYLKLLILSQEEPESNEEIDWLGFPEMTALIKSVFTLRHFLKKLIPGEIDTLNREIEYQFNQYTIRDRKKRSYGCGYSPVVISPGYLRLRGRGYFSQSIKFATFFQHIGNNSVFSLGQDTHMELLSLETTFRGNYPFMTTEETRQKSFFDIHLVTLEFKKIISGSRLEYRGWWNPGFAITLYEVYTDRLRNVKRDTTAFSLRYILNVVEVDNFRNFLNFEIGTGFSFRSDMADRVRRYLDTIFEIHGKFHLSATSRSAIRFFVSFRPRFNLNFYSFSRFKTGLELDWSLGAYHNGRLCTGFSFEDEKLHYRPDADNNFSGSRFALYISYRINDKILPGWADIKKFLNKIF